ncbi:MAG: amidase, partial [Nocardioides sp.]|nr:amidase [Nocardioides sp.]
MTVPTGLSAVQTAQRVAARELSAVEAVDAALERISRLDPALNAFSVVLADAAKADAADLDASIDAGVPPGPLAGVPVAVKEEIAVAGTVSTFGGRGNTTPEQHDSEMVRRLRAAGAIIVGKTVMPEFGAWPFTESARYGHTHNPWDPTRSPGGSSGGSAVAVATGMVPVAFGGDGGGS